MISYSGGTSTASGLYYQYLFTIETALRMISADTNLDFEVQIENLTQGQDADPHAVDFSIHHPDGTVLAVHQAKSAVRPHLSKLSAAQALISISRLVLGNNAQRYRLDTNQLPGKDVSRLSAAFGTSREIKTNDEIAKEIGKIVRHSRKATEALARIVAHPQGIDRLRRARVSATGEVSETIRQRIALSIRGIRQQERMALGDHASRMLVNQLVAEVFSVAAGVSKKALTLSEISHAISADSGLLSSVVGVDESGFGVWHVPDASGIERRDVARWIDEQFHDVSIQRIRRCCLAGHSGKGKTRIAAIYAHQERAAYDRIWWIDADSEASIISSLLNQLAIDQSGDPSRLSPEVIRNRFIEYIAKFPGKSLVIFDNAVGPMDIVDWIPTAGTADILITSINTAGWTPVGIPMYVVPVLSSEQAYSLLIQRLEDDTSADSATGDRDALQRLAAELGNWPLALQIAAAHFQTISRAAQSVDGFLDELANYAIDDPTLVRDGYPRTLLASINICLDRLGEQSSESARIGMKMLEASSFMEGHSIPTVLLHEIACRKRDVSIRAPARTPELNVCLRYIASSTSLFSTRRSTSPSGAVELSEVVDINELVQEIVRRRVADVRAAVSECCRHLSLWLVRYATREQFAAGSSVLPHALKVSDHARISGIAASQRAELLGNSAIFLRLRGDARGALAMYAEELTLLYSMHPTSFRLLAITHCVMAQIHIQLGHGRHIVLLSAQRACLAIESWEVDSKTASDLKECVTGLASVIDALRRRATHDGLDTSDLEDLQGRLLDLCAAWGLASQGLGYGADSINQALDGGNYDDAARQARELYQDRGTSALRRLEGRSLEIEAVAWQTLDPHLASSSCRKLRELVIEFNREHENVDHLNTGFGDYILNAAMSFCRFLPLYIRTEMSGDSVPMGEFLLAFQDVLDLAEKLVVSKYDRYRHLVATCVIMALRDEVTGVQAVLHRVQDPPELPQLNRSNEFVELTVQELNDWLSRKMV